MRRLAVILLLLVSGCARVERVPQARQDYICFNADLVPAAKAWLTEARKKHDDPFLIICHGVEWEGLDRISEELKRERLYEWMLDPDPAITPRPCDARPIVWAIRELHPDRDIVMIVCNTYGHVLSMDRVYHSTRVVGKWPRDRYPDDSKMERNIEKFITKGTNPLDRPSTRPSTRPH